MSFIATASPRRFMTAASALIREAPTRAQVYRVDGGRDVPVDVDTILRIPGNYVLRALERCDDEDEDRWVDGPTCSVGLDDDEAGGAGARAKAKGEAAKDEGWTLLVQSQQRTIDRLQARIDELERKVEKEQKGSASLKEDLAEAAAEAENGAGRWAELIEKFGPHLFAIISGAQFRQELAARLSGLKLPPKKQDELLSILNHPAMRGPRKPGESGEEG